MVAPSDRPAARHHNERFPSPSAPPKILCSPVSVPLPRLRSSSPIQTSTVRCGRGQFRSCRRPACTDHGDPILHRPTWLRRIATPAPPGTAHWLGRRSSGNVRPTFGIVGGLTTLSTPTLAPQVPTGLPRWWWCFVGHCRHHISNVVLVVINAATVPILAATNPAQPILVGLRRFTQPLCVGGKILDGAATRRTLAHDVFSLFFLHPREPVVFIKIPLSINC